MSRAGPVSVVARKVASADSAARLDPGDGQGPESILSPVGWRDLSGKALPPQEVAHRLFRSQRRPPAKSPGRPEEEMDRRTATRLSKFLSLVLRHRPDDYGLAMDEQGFVDFESLIDVLVAEDIVAETAEQ